MYRIFIVEDDKIIANLLKKNLCSWGYDVSCAEDFSNIIQEFAHRDPQLVLLDLKLPFYNGSLLFIGMTNTKLFIGCTAGTVLIFALVYGLIYIMTAKSYYHIVERK